MTSNPRFIMALADYKDTEVPSRGFEPLIFGLKGRCPGPLDDEGIPLRRTKVKDKGRGIPAL
jgi:hypothetical protein